MKTSDTLITIAETHIREFLQFASNMEELKLREEALIKGIERAFDRKRDELKTLGERS